MPDTITAVIGDTEIELNEEFFLRIQDITGAFSSQTLDTLPSTEGLGIGQIIDDD